jgi:hypothetical protein
VFDNDENVEQSEGRGDRNEEIAGREFIGKNREFLHYTIHRQVGQKYCALRQHCRALFQILVGALIAKSPSTPFD